MGANSGIEWTDHTFNAWWGCVKVSPACDHCYAEVMAKRTGFQVWGKGADRRMMTDAYWNQPLSWNRWCEKRGERRRVFCGSMCDVMEDAPGIQEIREAKLYPLIEATPLLDWLLLTKRPQNFLRFLPAAWLEHPRSNVWGMTTVESDDYRWRATELLKTPFAVRGLSMEPLLGPVDIGALLPDDFTGGVDWVIAGGESGPQARPSHPDWFRRLRDQCAAARVPFLFKQWGEWSPLGPFDAHECFVCEQGCKGDITREAMLACESEHSPANRTVMRRIGKKRAGRLLDGREHLEFPEVRR